jgi:phospholipid transport system transporter-binding protein
VKNPMSIVIQNSGHVIVDGDMTFSSIEKKISSAFDFLTRTKQVTVDLSGVGNADSAGLALLIEWIKYARSKRVQLRIKNVPNQILNLAKLSGLENADYFH